MPMTTTRVFKSGNSQAIRIPSELAYTDFPGDLTITRQGDVITIFTKREGLKEAVEALRRLPKPTVIENREPIDVPDRGALDLCHDGPPAAQEAIRPIWVAVSVNAGGLSRAANE